MRRVSNRADLKDGLKIQVLPVNDNEAFLRAATEFLQRQRELTVVGAICESEEALVQVQDLRPQVILIGMEIFSRLRKVLPALGTIALTLLEGDACC